MENKIVCIQKTWDMNGVAVNYTLCDAKGRTSTYTVQQLTTLMQRGKIRVLNLKLSQRGRIVENIHDDKCIDSTVTAMQTGNTPVPQNTTKSASNQYMKHYSGELGTFDYDSRDFEIVRDCFTHLKYIGPFIDGSKIKIPTGITNCNSMFAFNDDLRTPPVIPEGVENCVCMFMNCTLLKYAPELPSTVKYCTSMFEACLSMTAAPKNIPVTMLTEGTYLDMFRTCPQLMNRPNLPPEAFGKDDLYWQKHNTNHNQHL